jgi:hypothetical protein
MKKIWSSLLMATVIGFGVVGCGSSDDASVGNENVAPSSNDTAEVVTPTPPTSSSSPYLNKLGDNGTVLSPSATSWKMVEFKDIGLMLEEKTILNHNLTYGYEDSKNYCQSLELAGYTDWRLPTREEATAIFNIMSISSGERAYFKYYMADYICRNAKCSIYISYPVIWTSTYHLTKSTDYFSGLSLYNDILGGKGYGTKTIAAQKDSVSGTHPYCVRSDGGSTFVESEQPVAEPIWNLTVETTVTRSESTGGKSTDGSHHNEYNIKDKEVPTSTNKNNAFALLVNTH